MEGLRVVELGVWVAGPAAGGILADWGADVVKIEPPAGDPARQFARMLGGDLPYNPPFELDNRSKRSIVVDLATDEGRDVALRLVAGADVFVTNVRPAGLARAGLDYESLSAGNPGLVYAVIVGYGLEGPDADAGAYDIAAFWARAGIAHLLTQPGGEPPFQRGGMGDHSVAMSCAAAIGAALYARERTGRGQMVSTSLYRQGAYTIGFDLNVALRFGVTIGSARRESMGNPAINHYKAGDGRRFWLVGLEGDRHWPPLARVVGHPEWVDDPRFASAADRATNAAELISLLDEEFASRALDEWAGAFDAEPDLFWAPVQTPEDVLADEQFRAAGGLVEVPDGPTTATMIATPADFSGTPWAPRAMPPDQGQHTDETLGELGLADHEIEALRDVGAVA